MPPEIPLQDALTSESFLEYAFLRWVLAPASYPQIARLVTPQCKVSIAEHTYKVDYVIRGKECCFAIELDGFEFHGSRYAFSYDRLRQNDLHAAGFTVIRFSYDAIRRDTARCVQQLQAVLALDTSIVPLLREDPVIEAPEMDPDPLYGFITSPQVRREMPVSYFEIIQGRINTKPLRDCQAEALAAIGNYYRGSGTRAACIMSVGAGKTALGVVVCLAFARKRAMVITPGTVIRGTFARAFDHQAVGNALYGLPRGPLLPGSRPPTVLSLDRDGGPIREISREDLLAADVIITNFHSLGTGDDPDDLLAKLHTEDIDLVVVDEAHIAAAESYQRTFRHFTNARTLLMSACFQRLDGKPIDADVVYRYRLIDSIADGHAKNLRVRRFAPESEETTYEMIWPDGSCEEIVGRARLLELIHDERKLARITAKSDESIRQIMRVVATALAEQTELLYPVKPRVLFSALGERHAEQVSRIAEEYGIPCAYLHHSMTEVRIRATRDRFEQDSGDLQGIVQLKMLGQGYDFPPITIVVPMRPYGSFSEFYQFVGRGIRVLQHLALQGRVGADEQYLDIIYHAEMGLDDHIDTIYHENDMDPITAHIIPEDWQTDGNEEGKLLLGTLGRDEAIRPEAFVLFERGAIENRIIHDENRVEMRRAEREREALAQKYAAYAQTNEQPVSFEQFVTIMQMLNKE
jgi:superfamily II DNA or RNA helicase